MMFIDQSIISVDFRYLVKKCVPKIQFSNFSTNIYVVGTQKYRLNETVSDFFTCASWVSDACFSQRTHDFKP